MPDGQVIVTGASRGIGAAIAAELSARGYSIAALSRSGDAAHGYGVICDISDESALASSIKAIGERGPIAGLVNCAGAHHAGSSATLSATDFEATMRLNATGVLVASREVYPHLMAAGGGTIVNIGSFFDKLGVARNTAYCASKAAVGAITRCLAVEWASDNITVVNVAPGYVETDLNRDFLASDKIKSWLSRRVPVGRAGQPGEVARLVGALFEERLAFLTGETIYIDGGQGMSQ